MAVPTQPQAALSLLIADDGQDAIGELQNIPTAFTLLARLRDIAVGLGAIAGAITIADGADVTQGAITDAIVAAGAPGSVSAKLRRLTQGLEDLEAAVEDLKTLITLGANSGVDIGDVDVLTVGTASKTVATGAGAIAASHAISSQSVIDHVSVHFDTAPTTSQNLTVTINATDGAAYDTVIFTVNPSLSSATDILYQPDGPVHLFTGDSVDVAFTNTDARTYGVRIVSVAV